MKIGQILRAASPANPEPKTVDGFTNFYYATHSPGRKLVKLDRGINPTGLVHTPQGPRRPAIVVSSSPHKIGSSDTPWQDFFDPDNGHVRYFGDNKTPGRDPALALGNKSMLEAKRLQDAMEPNLRETAPPVLIFKRMRVKGKVKGYPAFQGFGIIERAELISQYDARKETSFPNYAFDICILDLSHEFEEFNWHWITSRRDPQCSSRDALQHAPKSWVTWVYEGASSLPKVRRSVTKTLVTPVSIQRPDPRSQEARALEEIYVFFDGRKTRFELLAARIAGRILEEKGGDFRFGWVTRGTGDGGADFVGRLDIGSGFSTLKQVVYGQAKCEAPTSTASGKDIARTVARLRRGWIGAFVTLGAFSIPVQREVIQDEYPILLVPGERVAKEVISASKEMGASTVRQFLERIDGEFDQVVADRDPQQVLRM